MLPPAVAAEFLVLALPRSMDIVLEPRLGAVTTGLFRMLEEDITVPVLSVLRTGRVSAAAVSLCLLFVTKLLSSPSLSPLTIPPPRQLRPR